jgi:hypothetical protein
MAQSPPKQLGAALGLDRRGASRHNARLRLLFPWGDRILQAHSVDLSATGMRVETLVNLGIGTSLVMHFAPSGENVTQRLAVRVMWVREPKPPSALYEAGFRFEEVSEAARQSLAKVLNEHAAATIEQVGDGDIVETADEGAGFSGPLAGAKLSGSDISKAVRSDEGRQAERRREAEALSREGTAAAQSGSLARAATLLEQSLALAPDSREITEELARVLYLKGDVARAAVLFDKALRLAQEQT